MLHLFTAYSLASYASGSSRFTHSRDQLTQDPHPVKKSNNGHLGTIISSARFETSITDLGSRSDILYELRPVAFQYKPEIDPSRLTQYGLIAEAAPDLVIADEDGEPYTVRYEQLVPLLLNEVQEQQSEIDELRAEMEVLKQAIGD